MKSRIIVALIIMLSMCMVCAAVSHEDKVYWRFEGIQDGYPDGYNDGRNGNDHNYSNMEYPNDCPGPCESSYEQGYLEGYKDGYSDGVDKPEKEIENCMSSPSLGLGFKYPNGTVTQRGDHVPTLYTWAEVDDKYEHHTTLTFPAEGIYSGCVIITPPQIAGEPLVPTGFWDTPKGQRILQWKANAG